MIFIETLRIINAFDHLFIIVYRLFIDFFVVSLYNVSCFYDQMKNPLRHFFFLYILSLVHVMYKRENVIDFPLLFLN